MERWQSYFSKARGRKMLTKQKREFLRTNYEITDIQLDEFINALNESINIIRMMCK